MRAETSVLDQFSIASCLEQVEVNPRKMCRLVAVLVVLPYFITKIFAYDVVCSDNDVDVLLEGKTN